MKVVPENFVLVFLSCCIGFEVGWVLNCVVVIDSKVKFYLLSMVVVVVKRRHGNRLRQQLA